MEMENSTNNQEPAPISSSVPTPNPIALTSPATLPSSPPKKSPFNSKRILIAAFILVLLVVTSVSAYLVLGGKRTNLTFRQPTSTLNQNANLDGCSLTGQSATGSPLKVVETKFTNSAQPIDISSDSNQQIIARVLNTSPFVLEILDMKTQPGHVFDSLGLQEGMFVDVGEKSRLSQLKFNDLITGDLYGFTYASVELAMGTAIKNIQKVDEATYFNTSPNSFANRSGTLIRYAPANTNSNGFLLIFNDGKVFYRDNNNNIFTDKTLTNSELDNILKQFSLVSFDKIPTDYEASLYSPSLVLVCNRYQKVNLKEEVSNLNPVLHSLDAVIQSYQANAKYTLTYDKKFTIKDWQYVSIVPLDQANNISFRQQNKERLSKMKPSAELSKEVEDFNTYYRYDGKLYGVYFGSCVDGSAGTWGCFGAEELKNQNQGGRRYNIWPTELSTKLKDVSRSGTDISKEEYQNHKDFYDKLLTWDDNLLFLEGDFLYKRLSLSLR